MPGKQVLRRRLSSQQEFSLPLNLWNPDQPKYLPTQAKFFGDWGYRFRAYGGGLANGKCVRFDTLIDTATGRKPITEIQVGELVWSVTTDQKLTLAPVTATVDSGVLPEYRIRLDNGMALSCSPWHPLLRMAGTRRQINFSLPTKQESGARKDRRERIAAGVEWVRADEVKPGDRLAVAMGFPSGQPGNYSDDHLYLLGVLLGDGGLTDPGVINLTIGQQELVQEVRRIVTDEGLHLTKLGDLYSYRISAKNTGKAGRNPLLNELRALGLAGTSSHTKFIPPSFFALLHSQIAALLSGLFVTDGWVDRNYVGYCSVSERLIDGVQALLARLEIRSQKCRRLVTYKGGKRPAFNLQISDAQSVRRCVEWLNLRWKQPKLIRLHERNQSKVPRGSTRRFLDGNVEFVRVSSVQQGEPVQMHDITVAGTHNFIGNGIVAHNTSGGVALAYHLSTCFPGNCGYIGRWDGKELLQTTMAEFFRVIPADMFEVQNKQMGYLRFKREYGGSEIYYGDLKKEEWASSLNLGWFWFDQAEEVDEARWNHGVSRLRRLTPILEENGEPVRWPNGEAMVAPTYGFVTFNPEGTHSFLWRFFHPDSPTRQAEYQLYQATTYDGLAAGFVKQDYVDAMLSVYPEAARKRYLDGSWDVFEGKVFSQFAPQEHVIDPIPLSPAWSYYVGIDHGLQNPTSVGVWAVTPSGIKIRIREHYEGNGKPVSYHAACLHNLIADLPKRPALMIMDPACWAKTQSRDNRVLSVVDEYHEHDIYPIPGDNTWERTFNLMNEALMKNPDVLHPVTGQRGCPTLLAFSTCHHWIREMSNYKWKKARGAVLRNAPDEPVDYNDHAIDETRYVLSKLPAVVKPTEAQPILTALDKWRIVREGYNPLGSSSWTSGGSWMSN